MHTPEERARFGLLFDFYGELLSERQRDMVDYYYNEDLSLSEIAAIVGITRQGVRDGIKKSEALLVHYEQTLGLVARFRRTDEKLRDILETIGARYPTDTSLAALIATATTLLDRPEA